ncbi:MAG: ribonuclease Z, partial [Spirochaetaceae bacterium]|nr:ribonuclease Z [Spirochaetaceae bacterium]
CYGYTFEEDTRSGEFYPQKAAALGIPMGPLWSKLQHGEAVQLPDGTEARPEDVMGQPRKGRKFSFITDTRYFDGIAANVENADFLVCEGMFEQALIEDAYEKGHMTAEQAARIALAADVKKMALIHYSPRYNDYELGMLLKEAQAVFPRTILSRDRSVHTIEYED